MKWESVWNPQKGPQNDLFECPVPEVFFGGARGGGKTDGVLGKWGAKALQYGAAFNALLFRRTMPSQDDAWERAQSIYRPVGAQFTDQNKSIRFPNGARIRFRFLDTVSDADLYQGQNVSDVWVEEAGQYPTPAPIDRLHGVIRSATGIPTQLILTGNPGGAGQLWIKARYIDPEPKGMRVLSRELPNGAFHRYVFIPSKIGDNRILLDADPGYINRLYLVGSAQLVEAWLNGDWNAIEGAFFDGWSSTKHVISPFAVPADWLRFRSMDWGYASPFSVGWWAVAADDHWPWPSGSVGGNASLVPRGALVRYREWYGATSSNVGIRQTAEQVAVGISQREVEENITYGVLDPSAFAHTSGPSIAERLAESGAVFRRADNTRLSLGRGAMGGWDQMRARLRGDGEYPALYVFDTCKDFIRTIPVLQHDPEKAEDLDTEQEDHVADECRYACMSRPYIPELKVAPKKPGLIYEAQPDGTVVANKSVMEWVLEKKRARERA